jgi:hypothetical protein
MRDEGAPVRFVRSIFVPEDETCFYVFQASSSEEVNEAARRAALPRVGAAKAISAERPREKGTR